MHRKIEYALMALKFMSQKLAGQLSTAKEICEQTGTPFDATARVMQIMAQQGLLKSEQGPTGGYLLAKDLSKVPFYDLMEMILGRLAVVKCLEGEGCDLSENCSVRSPLNILNEKLIDFYKGINVAELLQLKSIGKQKEEKPFASSLALAVDELKHFEKMGSKL